MVSTPTSLSPVLARRVLLCVLLKEASLSPSSSSLTHPKNTWVPFFPSSPFSPHSGSFQCAIWSLKSAVCLVKGQLVFIPPHSLQLFHVCVMTDGGRDSNALLVSPYHCNGGHLGFSLNPPQPQPHSHPCLAQGTRQSVAIITTTSEKAWEMHTRSMRPCASEGWSD